MSERVTVTVKEGKICGMKKTSSFSGIEYYSFLGVPYGQPTGGNARFKDPVKVKPWNDVLNATGEKLGCIHFSFVHMKIVGTEDCLYNNIHTPKLPSQSDALKAVIVNIHPGGFFHGSPDPHYYGSPDYIINQDVVFVCVGYRLHILGGLNLNVKGCTGNQALKDIILSLKWIKENIHVFGGDPENVTLIGSSSGSYTVHMLLLSSLANGLYHKAVLMGTYATSPVLVLHEENAYIAHKIAGQLGYKEDMDDKKKLLKFYRQLDIKLLLTLRPEVQFSQDAELFPASPFLPTPTPDHHLGEQAVFPFPSSKLIPFTNRVPLMVGFCEKEAGMALAAIQNLRGSSLSDYFEKTLGRNPCGWGANLNEEECKRILKEIESFYMNGLSIDEASQSMKCDILTDMTLSDIYDSLINVVSADLPSSVFVYKFAHESDLGATKLAHTKYLKEPLRGTFHADDYAHWVNTMNILKTTSMKKNIPLSDLRQADRETINTLTSLIATFAKTGNPNYNGLPVRWNPSTPEKPSYLKIDETLESKNELLNGKPTKFWNNLKRQFMKSFPTILLHIKDIQIENK